MTVGCAEDVLKSNTNAIYPEMERLPANSSIFFCEVERAPDCEHSYPMTLIRIASSSLFSCACQNSSEAGSDSLCLARKTSLLQILIIMFNLLNKAKE
jgi:hypothetical protein